MANSGQNLSFDDMIQADRKKKRQEMLAQSILGRGRALAPGQRNPTATGLSTRVGVTKRSSSAQPKSNIDGRWGHDLHHVNNPLSSRPAHLRRNRTPLSASTLTTLEREVQHDREMGARSADPGPSTRQANVRQSSQLSIKGMANPGPFVVVASNFASGTTAADIEAAMEPVGGEIQSCSLISAHPTVMCEILFTDKAGADNVVNTFNNQKADGRLLYVYHKQGGPSPQLHPLHNAATSAKAPASPAPAPVPAPAPASAPAPTEQPFDPPKGPRESSSRNMAPQANPPDDRESMDVDDDPRAPREEYDGHDERYDDRGRDRDRYRNSDRDHNGHVDGRYGFGNQYNRRDGRRNYPRGPRGLYSDGMYRNDRRYRP